jgi:radical SAM enzyme (TIGR01210 family)
MRSWFTQEIVSHEVVTALNVIIPTRGCSWNNCTMCSYSLQAGEEPFREEFMQLMERDFEKLKIFTSGSFLDRTELPVSQRNDLLDMVKERGVKELTIETRPEYVKEAPSVQKYLGDIVLEVALGLESSNDRILHYCINKGFLFEDFTRAVDTLKSIKVKAYLLIKPPFLTEYEAIEDAVRSAHMIADMVDVISFNPVAIHKKTVLEYLWRTKMYSPPWLWSVVEVLNRCRHLPLHIICHPVAVGTRRGVKNCRKCTSRVAEKIRTFSLTNEEIDHDCACREEWKRECDRL